MRLGVKFAVTTAVIIVILSIMLETVSLSVFTRAMDNLNKQLFEEKVDGLLLLAYEQNELFFEGVYKDEEDSKFRVIDKLRIEYRDMKDEDTYPFVVDRTGATILHPTHRRGEQNFDKDHMRQIIRQKAGNFEYVHEGRKKWCVFKTYEPWGWIFCMTTSVQKKDEPIREFMAVSLVISIAIILLSIVVFLLVSRRQIRPLNKVIDRLQKISKGDVKSVKRLDVDQKTSDEIGLLSTAFNKMADDLSKITVSRDYFDNILSSITDILLVLSPEGRILQDNKATFDQLGYSNKELIGQDVSILFPEGEENIPLKGERLKELLQGGSFIAHETSFRAKIGILVPMLLSGAVMKDKHHQVTHIVCIAKNITQLKKSQEALTKANQDLKNNEKALREIMREMEKTQEELKAAQSQLIQSEKLASLGQLSAGIAHEINNPLGFIINNIVVLAKYVEEYGRVLTAMQEVKEKLSQKNMDQALVAVEEVNRIEEDANLQFIRDDVNDLISQTKSGAERIKKIVEDLRTFSRKDEGDAELNNIEEVLDGIITIVWNEIKYKANLKKDYGHVPPVSCNAQKVGQVFINLLVNAAQAIKESGDITVKTYLDGKYVCVSVSDTGSGISSENMNKIFDPFFTTKDVGKGTGLGLSICYEIIKRHDGEITVVSEIDQGTTFTVKLPLG